MRAISILILTAYAVVAWMGSIPAVLAFMGIGLAGTGLVLVLDWVWNHGHEARSLRRIRARVHRHACPRCGDVHGGPGQ